MSEQDPTKIADRLEDVLDGGLRETMDARQTADRLRNILPDLREAMHQTKRELVQEMKEEDHFKILVDETPTFESLFGGLYETRYTKLLEWFLEKNDELSRKMICAFFPDNEQRKKLVDHLENHSSEFKVESETGTDSGEPDLLISSQEKTGLEIYVEIKTGADETTDQLQRYAGELQDTSYRDGYLICLLSDESNLHSEEEAKKRLGNRYQRRYWIPFLRHVRQYAEEIDVSEETGFMLRMLVRDRVLAAADLGEYDQRALRNLRDKEDLDELDLELDDLQNLRDAVMELEQG